MAPNLSFGAHFSRPRSSSRLFFQPFDIIIDRQSILEMDLIILFLRQQLSILKRKLNFPIRPTRIEKLPPSNLTVKPISILSLKKCRKKTSDEFSYPKFLNLPGCYPWKSWLNTERASQPVLPWAIWKIVATPQVGLGAWQRHALAILFRKNSHSICQGVR